MGGSKRIFKPQKGGNIISRNWKGYKWVNGVMMTAKQARAADLRQASSTFTRKHEMETTEKKLRVNRTFSLIRSAKAKELIGKWLVDHPGWHSWEGDMRAALQEPLFAAGYESMNAARTVIYTMSDLGDILHVYVAASARNLYAVLGTPLEEGMTRVISKRLRAAAGSVIRRSPVPQVLQEQHREREATRPKASGGSIQIEVRASEGRIFMRNGGMFLELAGQVKFMVADTEIEVTVMQ